MISPFFYNKDNLKIGLFWIRQFCILHNDVNVKDVYKSYCIWKISIYLNVKQCHRFALLFEKEYKRYTLFVWKRLLCFREAYSFAYISGRLICALMCRSIYNMYFIKKLIQKKHYNELIYIYKSKESLRKWHLW